MLTVEIGWLLVLFRRSHLPAVGHPSYSATVQTKICVAGELYIRSSVVVVGSLSGKADLLRVAPCCCSLSPRSGGIDTGRSG